MIGTLDQNEGVGPGGGVIDSLIFELLILRGHSILGG